MTSFLPIFDYADAVEDPTQESSKAKRADASRLPRSAPTPGTVPQHEGLPQAQPAHLAEDNKTSPASTKSTEPGKKSVLKKGTKKAGKAKKRSEADEKEKARRARAEVIARDLQARRKVVFDMQMLLLEGNISEEQLLSARPVLSKAEYDDVIEERNIYGTCGYPPCSNSLPPQSEEPSTSRYKISLKDKKVYDRTLPNRFCSNQCALASKAFSKLLDEQPSGRLDEDSFAEVIAAILDADSTGASGKVTMKGKVAEVGKSIAPEKAMKSELSASAWGQAVRGETGICNKASELTITEREGPVPRTSMPQGAPGAIDGYVPSDRRKDEAVSCRDTIDGDWTEGIGQGGPLDWQLTSNPQPSSLENGQGEVEEAQGPNSSKKQVRWADAEESLEILEPNSTAASSQEPSKDPKGKRVVQGGADSEGALKVVRETWNDGEPSEELFESLALERTSSLGNIGREVPASESDQDEPSPSPRDEGKPTGNWLDKPPLGFSLKLSPFSSLLLAFDSWVSAEAVLFIAGIKVPAGKLTDVLAIEGKEYWPKRHLSDGTSPDIGRALAEFVRRAAKEVHQMLRMKVTLSVVEQSLGQLVSLFSFTQPLPAFTHGQWVLVTQVMLQAVAVKHLPQVTQYLENHQQLLEEVVKSTGFLMAEYNVLLDYLLPDLDEAAKVGADLLGRVQEQ